MSDIRLAIGELPATATQRWNANIAAIRLIKELEEQGREPTADERMVLSRYSGMGDSTFNPAFRRGYLPRDASDNERRWRERGEELRELVTEEEYQAMGNSARNAFYTSPEVISSMWRGLEGMGLNELDNPVILEPSAGAGRFLGLQPEESANKSERIAVELDTITGNILKNAYPETDVYVMGFQDAPVADNSVDVAISNVPFSDIGIYDEGFQLSDDPGLRQAAKTTHNYFFAKTMQKLRPGGVMAFITSKGTLDSRDARKFREHLATQGEMLGAVRLPSETFGDTDVVTDLIYMRKFDEGEKPPSELPAWVYSDAMEVPASDDEPADNNAIHYVNRYYHENPEMVLGKQTNSGSMYRGQTYNVEAEGGRFDPRLLDRQTAAIVKDAPDLREWERRGDVAPLPTEGQNTSGDKNRQMDGVHFIADDGRVMVHKQDYGEIVLRTPYYDNEDELQYRETKRIVPQGDIYTVDATFKTAQEEDKVRRMLELRDDSRALLDAEATDEDSDEELTARRDQLRADYEEFREKYGPINAFTLTKNGQRRWTNAALLKEDPTLPFIRALETRTENGWTPTDLFTQRSLGGAYSVTASNASDAMSVVLNERGRLDFDRMGELLGRSGESVQKELSEQGLVFYNPETAGWEPAEKYLSGPVRDKLRTAQLLLEQGHDRYANNVRYLENNQPADVGAGEIYVKLGAPWIPPHIINQFIAETFRPGVTYNRGEMIPWARYDERRGRWEVSRPIQASMAANQRWGTERRSPKDLLLSALRGKAPKVETRDPGTGKTYLDMEATQAAQDRVDELHEEFSRWLWADPSRAAELTRLYNDRYNKYKPRTFDGSHLTFPNMDIEWSEKLRDYQRDGAYRAVQDPTVMLAHEVGFGKTATMVAAIMERRRLGLAKKPFVVTPKATVHQFIQQMTELYPNARILYPSTSEDISERNREVFLHRARTGDWDAVVLTMEQFESIPVKNSTAAEFHEQRLSDLHESLTAANEEADDMGVEDGKKTRTESDIESAIEREQLRLRLLRTEQARKADEFGEHFEDLGIDMLVVDEADNYKNLQFTTTMNNIRGVNPVGSQRAWDMYMKTQYLLDNMPISSGSKVKRSDLPKKSIVFATGTPVANSLAEAWSMMRYLQPDVLNKMGLTQFDAWANSYGDVSYAIEPKTSGKYEPVERFRSFHNLPELSNALQQSWDIRMVSEVPEMSYRRPLMLGGNEGSDKNEGRYQEVSPMYDDLLDYKDQLLKREAKIKARKVDPTEDNWLKMANDARDASLDVRMADPDLDPGPRTKIPMAAANVAKIYHEEMPDLGTQLVFLDRGVVKKQMYNPKTGRLQDLYTVFKALAVGHGIPENEIAFMQDYKDNPRKKAQLFEDVRNGKIRVLVGSTDSMGVGVNVQDRVAAMHHIDVPWRPRDLEQREGRGIRQGNMYGPKFTPDGKRMVDPGDGIRVFNYLQQGSFDEVMWNAVEQKAAGIKALMRRNVTVRSIEEPSEFVMDAAAAKALSSGNPAVIKLENLNQILNKMRFQRANHYSDQALRAQHMGELTDQIERVERNLDQTKAGATFAAAAKETEDKYALTVGKETFEGESKRQAGREALTEALQAIPDGSREWKKLGSYKGFEVQGQNVGTGFRIALKDPNSGALGESTVFSDAENGQATFGRIINKIIDEGSRADKKLAGLKGDLADYERMGGVNEPYPEEERFAKLQAAQECLQTVAQGGECPPEVIERVGDESRWLPDRDQVNAVLGPAFFEKDTSGDRVVVPDYWPELYDPSADDRATEPPPVASTYRGESADEPPPASEPMTVVDDAPAPPVRLWSGRALKQGEVPVVLTERAAEPGDEAEFALSGQDLYQDLGDVYTSVVPLTEVDRQKGIPPASARDADLLLLDKADVLVVPGTVAADAPVQFDVRDKTYWGEVRGGPGERRTFKVEKPRRSSRARAGRMASVR